jgi:adenylylsulfate kinase
MSNDPAPRATNVTWDPRPDQPRRPLEGARSGRRDLWFTGLSGSGKSTISAALEVALIERGVFATASTETTSHG